MKHPKTTICGILFAVCFIGLLICMEWSAVCYDGMTSPLRVHGLVTARRLFAIGVALFGLLGHHLAKDHDK